MRRCWYETVLLLIAIQLLSMDVSAYQFGAREDVAQWRAEPSTAHLCELHHPIPEYGEAVFSQRSGQALTFELNSFRPLTQAGSVEVSAVAPAWLHHIDGRHLGVITSQMGLQPIATTDTLAELVLDELQAGLFPLITHEGWTQPHPVEVVISAVHFKEAYAAFQTCIAQLLPGDFSDFEHSTVLFDTDKTDIKPQYQQRLNLIASYVLKDKSVQSVLLAGHTDSVWKSGYNTDLSRRRALAVKDYLLDKGLTDEQLQISFFGESKPQLANNTPANRQKNRRVVITLAKNNSNDKNTTIAPSDQQPDNSPSLRK